MRNTKRRPVTVGQMLVMEFLEPMNIEISELADAMGVHTNQHIFSVLGLFSDYKKWHEYLSA